MDDQTPARGQSRDGCYMEIYSLTYLKKIMHIGVRYKVIAHYLPEAVGQTCVVTMVTKHGFHSVFCDDAGKPIRGREREKWTLWWLLSSCWEFVDDQCTQYYSIKEHTDENFIATIRILG